ncbi:glycoside hydrolase family 5 protein [Streptomyces sp. DSM 15324]|uniref:glycoside hydrolase family 5 protein n=1 Tax=Streptomyces sp. DSM 15324 TaxID=1739111 RepID=UPI00074A133E|nr:glycoside hydrolase family 5 protein [Streptomyces sp. DSM 15324]KUO10003.1 cellulase [Streptomyces sp. DSM 15324]
MPPTHSRARRVAWTSLALAAAVGFLPANPAHAAGAGPAPKAATPVQTYGRLHVCGTQLCGQSGRPVQLRGMSTHGTQWYPQCLTGAALDAVAQDWKASVLRVSTYAREGAYRADPKKYTELASRLVDMASARGMYVIVDWHTIHPGDPHEDLDNARAFFTAIAEKHKDKDNVLYEIANEPHGVSWSTIKDYAAKIMPVIRSRAPGSVILVPTRGWSTLGAAEATNEKVIIADPVRDKNVMYTYHFYATAGREQFLKLLDRASDKLPVFVSEWAVASWNGWGTDYPMAQKFVDLMARKKISWTNWSLSDNHKDLSVFKKGACSTGKFGTASLSPNGVWVRDRIRG